MDTILVLDFGGQYCHLIGRRLRENNVYSEVVSSDISVDEIKKLGSKFNIKGLVLSGGPSSIYDDDAPKMEKAILDIGLPILGICYGHQLLAQYVNGEVKRAKTKEYGISFVDIKKSVGILKGLSKREQVWMSHGDTVLALPKDFDATASTENCPIAAFENSGRKIYGIQWHPEVVHTPHGNEVLSNFLFGICKCKKDWKPVDLIEKYVEEIKKSVGKDRALIAMSGGIDSATASALASKALGDRLTAVFVDNGLMRQGESEQIRVIANKLGINLRVVDAKEIFLKNLAGVADPEAKRKIIGRGFINVFEKVAKEIKADYLLQGTIYPDRIESGHSKNSNVIKTHHNVGGLPEKIKFKGLVEPLRDLYKDEVRKIAEQLGLPDAMVWRQPFPGPGLAVRINGAITKEKLDVIRHADFIVTDEFEKNKLNRSVWQYFAVLTDTRSTGVKGDARAYGNVIAVRAVESKEAMTANFAKIPYEVLEKVSSRMTNEIPEVVRVVYDITNKPPATIEWE